MNNSKNKSCTATARINFADKARTSGILGKKRLREGRGDDDNMMDQPSFEREINAYLVKVDTFLKDAVCSTKRAAPS